MTEHLRGALAAVRFNSAETPDDVWQTSPTHVEGLHAKAVTRIRAGIADAKASKGSSPVGLALQGQKGVGKTHLLGSVRRLVQAEGGYFFLIELTAGKLFWDDVADAMRSELSRADDDGELQLTALLRRLCAVAKVPAEVARAVVGESVLSAEDLRVFGAHLRKVDGRVAVECGDTIRALVLYASDHAEVGMAYLRGSAEMGEQRTRWGLSTEEKPPMTVVRDISRVLAMTGPCVVAIDQLDTLVNRGQDVTDAHEVEAELAQEVALIADGLMQLRERTRRTLSIVACLPNTWKLLHNIASDTVADRFRETPILGSIVDPEVARELVARWLGAVYTREGFTPPHATWPIAAEAFSGSWMPRTPREVLKRIHTHAESCLYGEIRELASFDEVPAEPPVTVVAEQREPEYFAEFDARFAELRAAAAVSAAGLKQHNEDDVMPALLMAGLKAWITEVGNDDMAWVAEPSSGSLLHAGLRRTVNEDLDVEERWGFRLIASSHGNRVLRRMRDARSAPGNRRLVLIRNGTKGWTGARTKAEVAELEQEGGSRVRISDEDLRTFSALKVMLSAQTHQLLAWLIARKPASSKTFLREILPDLGRREASHQETRPPPAHPHPAPPAAVSPAPSPVAPAVEQAAPVWVPPEDVPRPPAPRPHDPAWGSEIVLGMNGEVRIALESLRKHAVVFAGSGSGKTVLLRRIIEECALCGVSAIVLDPNNDLARLGDAWPWPPEGWRPDDHLLAPRYLAAADVVVWTPGRAGGRPLTFNPLPDFAGVLDDPDEFTASVEAAVARLIPHARLAGATKGALRGRAVLREALTHYARAGKRDLAGFIDVLAELPDGVSKLSTATKMAADLAETLRAATVNDPLLGGPGQATDPAVLLTPAPGKRARISVVNFVGLATEEQRQGFVSQLQMEVFAWIKRNPATDRPLGALMVMDEAQTIAPSGAWTASTQSTILLASQARKYGLGLLLATQAPKGLHNQVAGNATTQFFGRLNSPAQIAAATEIARAKGSAIGDIGRLERGHFYAAGDGFAFRRMLAPMCLSHHPPSPLRQEEVIDRAREG
ncbi:ATP-binding protein [Actinokineospora guangxiensis]|uniref:ATP-binding protein n=1 Tax=Actinokineospora guangxiensis TaxID=1490288 RepID=A0ABW0EUT0_9PSEU